MLSTVCTTQLKTHYGMFSCKKRQFLHCNSASISSSAIAMSSLLMQKWQYLNDNHILQYELSISIKNHIAIYRDIHIHIDIFISICIAHPSITHTHTDRQTDTHTHTHIRVTKDQHVCVENTSILQ